MPKIGPYPQVLLFPSSRDASDALKTALTQRAFVVVAGDCTVDYVGRASSKLGWGERFVIVKPDGSFLVHRNRGHDAVNWQPSGSKTIVGDSDNVVLNVYRSSPKERLSVRWRKLLLVAAFLLKDEAHFEMHLTEEELYQVILANPELIERGLRITSSQKHTTEGVPDFEGFDSQGNFVVIEIKKDTATSDDVKQVYKYLGSKRSSSPSTRGLLVAPGIEQRAKRLASFLHIEFVTVNLKLCAKMALAGRSVEELSTLDIHVR